MDQLPQSDCSSPQGSATPYPRILRYLGMTWAMGGLILPQFLLPAVAQSSPLDLAPAADPEPMLEPAAPLPAADPFVEPVAPAPVAAPLEALPSSNGVEPVSPAPTSAVQDPKPFETFSDTYIDPHGYGIGATPPQPYVQPSDTIGVGSGSGCQSISQVRPDLVDSLCAPPPRPTVYRQPPSPPRLAKSVPAIPRTDAFAPVVSRGLQAFQHGPRSYRLPYKIKPLNPGTNPLTWLQPLGQGMLFPLSVPATITSAFGWRLHPISGTQRFHAGTDIAAPTGTPVLAAYAGKVITADWLGGYGLSVLLEHDQGKSATRYAHLSEIFVKPGQAVKQGAVIGFVGNTGNSTGPHLHFETLQATPDGLVAVDPAIPLKIGLVHLINALQTARLTPQP